MSPRPLRTADLPRPRHRARLHRHLLLRPPLRPSARGTPTSPSVASSATQATRPRSTSAPGAPLVGPDGKRRKTHVLRVVLSHSRKGYSEAVCRQTTDDFLRCLEDAFRHFGGVPRRLVLDNLKAAVKKADWFDPEINPKVRSFGEYYGTVFLPTRPYTPRHKGKVERGVDYVQENALRGGASPAWRNRTGSSTDERAWGQIL